jgi:hypothetical protein
MLRFAGGRAAALFFAILGWFLHTIITSGPCVRSDFLPLWWLSREPRFFLSSSFLQNNLIEQNIGYTSINQHNNNKT